jgi:hypothetical protein
MSDDQKPVKVQLAGQSAQSPKRESVKVEGELADSEVEGVAGGGGTLTLSVQQVQMVVTGLTALHTAAWA